MIPLAILCAVLAAVIAWQRGSLRVARERCRSIEIYTDSARQELIATINGQSSSIATAYALLHDERHKGKMGNQAARDEWSAKVKGMKA
jgi:hypothetical protein